ncbi:hypothetical protein [Fusobacterium nucleatum]|uniref:hypothetical protein n=1 Tax=Fusobacterium nucleatum TaxID=851 RepID=UPI0030D06D44
MKYIKLEYINGLTELINLDNIKKIQIQNNLISFIFKDYEITNYPKEGPFAINNFEEIKELLFKISEN